MMNKINFLLLVLATFLFSCAKPISSFMIDQSGEVVPSKIQLKNDSKKSESYVWDFGDGSTSTEENPDHKYYLSGKYVVKLTAKKGNKTNTSEREIFFKAPNICLVELQTSAGNMLIQLYDDTPKHRDNFLQLAEQGYLKDLLFHRVIKGFMVQGGDPKSKNANKGARLGSGGPGYTIEAEINPKYIHKKGALSAARQGDNVNPEKRSSGSQFYIVQGKPVSSSILESSGPNGNSRYTTDQKEIYKTIGGTPFLDANYTVFGEVIEGIEIIDIIADQKTDKSDRPLRDVKILDLKIIK